MSDETVDIESTPEPADEVAQAEAKEAWRAVVAELDALGDAVGRWAKAAVHDPDNRRRANEFRERVERLGSKIGEAFEGGTESDAALKVRAAAEKAGDALRGVGERLNEDVAPAMASAFETIADKVRDAAERMEDKVTEDDEAADADLGEAEPESEEETE